MNEEDTQQKDNQPPISSNQNPKILEVVRLFESFAHELGPMEAKMPLYELQKLQKEIAPADFFEGLKLAAINSLQKNQISTVNRILEIDQKVSLDQEVQTAAKQYLLEAGARGWEMGETETAKFKKVFNL